MPTLIVTRNGVSLRIVRLREGEFRIGRSTSNHLVLANATVSKTHVVLTRQGRFNSISLLRFALRINRLRLSRGVDWRPARRLAAAWGSLGRRRFGRSCL